jgi:hypothetical protein
VPPPTVDELPGLISVPVAGALLTLKYFVSAMERISFLAIALTLFGFALRFLKAFCILRAALYRFGPGPRK